MTSINRRDGSTEKIRLASRSFLRHDFAHLSVELEIPLWNGFWGSVASGSPLQGKGTMSTELALAESLAGPVQTLIRTGAPVDQYLDLLNNKVPHLACVDLAQRIHERSRQLLGHWRGTPFGDDMVVEWPEAEDLSPC